MGSRTWRFRPHEPEITLDDAQKGVDAAHRRLGSLVHEPSLAGTSDVERSFLMAMAKDDGRSKMSDIAERLKADANYASQYRLRLIADELIQPAGRGYVDFALPYLREYLREHAAFEV